MNGGTPYGFAMTVSCVAMLGFGYFVFMGLNYHFEGNLFLPIVIVLFGCAVLTFCLLKMCKSKRMQGRRGGLPTEAGCAIASLCVLGLGCVPFSQFVNILDNEKELQQQLAVTIENTRTIGPEYVKYAEARVDAFRANLYAMSAGEYESVVHDIPGSSKSQKINTLCKSLRRRLLPATLHEVDSVRNAWLDEVGDMNVWNILAPRNIFTIGMVGQTWVREYREIFPDYYVGEGAEPFEMPLLDGSLGEFNHNFVAFSSPNVLSIIVALMVFVLVLTPYFIMRRGRGGMI